MSVDKKNLKNMRYHLSLLAEELYTLGPKVDSGRHKGSDVQKLHRALDAYLVLEQAIKELEEES